jgi:hypothetical protein
MFFMDHSPPHIHVIYGEYNAIFDINTLQMTEGDLPFKGQSLMKEWLGLHKGELIEMWDSQKIHALPPLE